MIERRYAVMVMKWMTRRWHGGQLSDDEEAAVAAGYRAHLKSVLPRLPEALHIFAGQPDAAGHVSLHDGRVEWWALDDGRNFTLQMLCGDLQLGYRRLVIQYRGQVDLFGAPRRDVANWLDDAQTEFLYDEVDVAADDRFEHRFLLWPQGEFGVRFEDAVVVSASAPPSTYSLLIRRKRLESSATFGGVLTAWEAGGRRARRLWVRLYDLRDAISRSSE